MMRLKDTIIADFWYQPKNNFDFIQKRKIFSYLNSKYLTFAAQNEDFQKKKFTNYDAATGTGI